jgi:drug/metabolite transporter (DMT)-like permease
MLAQYDDAKEYGTLPPHEGAKRKKRYFGVILMLLGSFCWGVSAILAKYLTDDVTVWQIFFIAGILQLCVICPILKIRGEPIIPGKASRFIFVGLLQALSDIATVYALQLLPVVFVSPIFSASPVYVLPLGLALKAFRFQRWMLLTSVIATAGVIIICSPAFATSTDEQAQGEVLGFVIAVLAGAMYSGSIVAVSMAGIPPDVKAPALYYALFDAGFDILISVPFAMAQQKTNIWPTNFIDWIYISGYGFMNLANSLLFLSGNAMEVCI